MMLDDFPELTGPALDWVSANYPDAFVCINDLRRRPDLPNCVHKWIEARDRWWTGREKAPLDMAIERDAWRMFGGEWIPGHACDEDGRLLAAKAALALGELGEERFRQWAASFYAARPNSITS